MTRELPPEYSSAVPAAPDASSLNRVRAAARSNFARRTSHSPSFRRLLAPAAVAIVALSALAWTLVPRVDDSAFARQQAVAALLPRDGVLHTRSTLELGRTGIEEQTIEYEEWIDYDSESARSVGSEPGSSRIGELTIRSGHLVRSMGRDAGPNGHYRIVQYEMPDEMTSPGGGYVELLRDALDSGSAKVVDRVTDGDEAYWIVETVIELSDKATGESTERVRATLRVGDYRLKNLSIRRSGRHPVDGEWKENVVLRFSAWEIVSRDSLPHDFFSPAQVDRAAPKDAIIEVPLEGSNGTDSSR